MATLVGAGIGAGVIVALDRAAADSRNSATATHPEPPTPQAAPTPAAPTPEQVEAANTQLCTSYAIAEAAVPNPQRSALDVMPVTNFIRWALADNPDASPDIRAALEELVRQSDIQMSRFGKVVAHGYAAPPQWHVENLQAAVDRSWQVCRLDE